MFLGGRYLGQRQGREGHKRNKSRSRKGGEEKSLHQYSFQAAPDKPHFMLPAKEEKPLLFCISKSSFISDIEFEPIAEQRQRIVTEGI